MSTPSAKAGPEAAQAVSVALERNGRYLLVLRANPPAQNLYAFPGGRVDPDETLEDAALRELEEETGLKAANPRPFATFDLSSDSAGDGSKSIFFSRSSSPTIPAETLSQWMTQSRSAGSHPTRYRTCRCRKAWSTA
jgi:ADP-ribose pyrophosphatase YjhB (NUDIX family)